MCAHGNPRRAGRDTSGRDGGVTDPTFSGGDSPRKTREVGEPFWVRVERDSPPENGTCEQSGEQRGEGRGQGEGRAGTVSEVRGPPPRGEVGAEGDGPASARFASVREGPDRSLVRVWLLFPPAPTQVRAPSCVVSEGASLLPDGSGSLTGQAGQVLVRR